MAKIEVACRNPKCGAKGKVDEEWAGKRLKCKRCGTVIEVPEETVFEVDVPQGDSRRVFVSYSHDDKRWFQEDSLIPWLARSLAKMNVQVWFDREGLRAGDEFRQRIEDEIDRADMAILLVSQSFLTSDFIQDVELPRIRDRAGRGQMVVIPILIEPCEWNDLDFISSRQMLPGEPTPLIDYVDSEREWAHVRFEILSGIKQRLKTAEHAPPPPVATQPEVKTEWSVDDTEPDPTRSGLEADEYPETWELAAFMAGQAAGNVCSLWRPVDQFKQLNELGQTTFRMTISIMDQYLQRFDMPFPLSGPWPDTSAEMANQVTTAFGARTPSQKNAFLVGYGVNAFSALTQMLYNTPDNRQREQTWNNVKQIPMGAEIAAAYFRMPSDITQELTAFKTMAVPDFNPAAGMELNQRTAALNNRFMEFFSAGQDLVPPEKRLITDRVTPWWDGEAFTAQKKGWRLF